MPNALRRALTGFGAETGGAVAVIAALTFPVLIGIASLSLEYGHGLLIRVENQRIADLASYAGASAYAKTRGTAGEKKTAAERAAESIASLNGINPDQVEVTFPQGPKGSSLVQTDILATRDLLLARVLSDALELNIRTQSVAGFGGTIPPVCLLALDEAGVVLNGRVGLHMPDCAVASSGDITLHGSKLEINVSECLSPNAPVEKDKPTEDDDCSRRSGGPFEDPHPDLAFWSGDDAFCDHKPGPLRNIELALALSGGKLAAGVHCIDSNVEITANTSLTANGPVTLIFSPEADLKLGGGASVNIAAPTSGDMKGILIHAPGSDITISGTADLHAAGCMGIVGRTITFSGRVEVHAKCSTEDREKLGGRMASVRLVR